MAPRDAKVRELNSRRGDRATRKRGTTMATTKSVEASSGGVIGWYGELQPGERRTFWACFGGWALDAMDVQIYAFVIPTLVATWKISNTQAGQLAQVALLLSAFGGW